MSLEEGLTRSGLTLAVSTTSHSSLGVNSDGMLPQGPPDQSRARGHTARAIERSFSRRIMVRRSAENVNPMRNSGSRVDVEMKHSEVTEAKHQRR